MNPQHADGVSRSGVRLVALYLGAFVLSAMVLLVLIRTQSGEYIDFAPFVLAGFSLPWSVAAFLIDHAIWSPLIAVVGVIANGVLLYLLGVWTDRRMDCRSRGALD